MSKTICLEQPNALTPPTVLVVQNKQDSLEDSDHWEIRGSDRLFYRAVVQNKQDCPEDSGH